MAYQLIEDLKGEAAAFVQAYLDRRPFQQLNWYAVLEVSSGDACLHVMIFDDVKIVESRDFPLPESSPLLPPLPRRVLKKTGLPSVRS